MTQTVPGRGRTTATIELSFYCRGNVPPCAGSSRFARQADWPQFRNAALQNPHCKVIANAPIYTV